MSEFMFINVVVVVNCQVNKFLVLTKSGHKVVPNSSFEWLDITSIVTQIFY
jgi:hypothetical protein